MMLANFESDTGEKYNILNMDYKIFTEGKTTVNQDNWQMFAKEIRPMEFDYAYAVTVHKAQGSEYKKVVLFNEYLGRDKEQWQRWLYTGITRSSEKLVIAL
jgi:ATP-dependent exoDNAse (exonuclease V) alpha subunit